MALWGSPTVDTKYGPLKLEEYQRLIVIILSDEVWQKAIELSRLTSDADNRPWGSTITSLQTIQML